MGNIGMNSKQRKTSFLNALGKAGMEELPEIIFHIWRQDRANEYPIDKLVQSGSVQKEFDMQGLRIRWICSGYRYEESDPVRQIQEGMVFKSASALWKV